MTDLGEMKKILGVKVERNWVDRILKISQGPYINNLLAQFQMQDANPVSTLLNRSVKLTSNNKVILDVPYAKAIGSHVHGLGVTRSVTPHWNSNPHFSMIQTCSKTSYHISHPSTNLSSVLGTPHAWPSPTLPIPYPFPATLTKGSIIPSQTYSSPCYARDPA